MIGRGLAVQPADQVVALGAERRRVPMSRTRTSEPSGSARTMMSANCSAVVSRPSVVTGRVSWVPGGAGSRPMRPGRIGGVLLLHRVAHVAHGDAELRHAVGVEPQQHRELESAEDRGVAHAGERA